MAWQKYIKRMTSELLNLAPEILKTKFSGKNLTIPYEQNSDLTVSIAQTREDFEGAFRILHNEYVYSKYQTPDPSGLRVTKYHILPSTTVIVAKIKGHVVGTISIIRDGKMGLPLESVFDVSQLRNNQFTFFAEFSSLAIHPDYREHGTVFFPLIKYAANLAHKTYGIDYFVFAVHPDYKSFYEKILHCHLLSDKIIPNYAFAQNAPAVALLVDVYESMWLSDLTEEYPKKETNPFYYVWRHRDDYLAAPEKRFYTIMEPTLTPSNLEYFGWEKTSLIKEMPFDERLKLLASYPNENYHAIVFKDQDVLFKQKRRDFRLQVKCHGTITRNSQPPIGILVFDVSHKGLRLYCPQSLEVGTQYSIDIKVGPKEVCFIEGELKNINVDNNYGFDVHKSTENWAQYIEHMLTHMPDAENDIEITIKTP